jgi:hypothetical protein
VRGMSSKAGNNLECCGQFKTEALRQLLDKHRFTAILLGIRRDKQGIRAKERVFSPRDAQFQWDYKNNLLSFGTSTSTGGREMSTSESIHYYTGRSMMFGLTSGAKGYRWSACTLRGKGCASGAHEIWTSEPRRSPISVISLLRNGDVLRKCISNLLPHTPKLHDTHHGRLDAWKTIMAARSTFPIRMTPGQWGGIN